jgi:hypothetical protein
MSYNYLALVNEVNRRLNEVELDTGTFPTAPGFHAQTKDAVNAAVRDIHQTHYEWPFNHATDEFVMTTGVTRYALPNDLSTVDMETFRIKEDATYGNETVKLRVMLYQDYLDSFVNQEYNDDHSDLPTHVFLTPNREIGFYPKPDNDYEVVYEYYRVPVDLVNATDVPTVPERFRHIIVDGAMYHAYMFRSNEQAATLAKNKFEEGIKRMRIMLMNDSAFQYIKSTYIADSHRRNIVGPRVTNG